MISKLILAVSVALLLTVSLAHESSNCLSDQDVHSPAVESSDVSEITDFGISLFKTVFPYKETRNFFYSPYSIWNALTLAYFGSKGNTEKQLREVLRVGDKVSTLKAWRANELM